MTEETEKFNLDAATPDQLHSYRHGVLDSRIHILRGQIEALQRQLEEAIATKAVLDNAGNITSAAAQDPTVEAIAHVEPTRQSTVEAPVDHDQLMGEDTSVVYLFKHHGLPEEVAKILYEKEIRRVGQMRGKSIREYSDLGVPIALIPSITRVLEEFDAATAK